MLDPLRLAARLLLALDLLAILPPRHERAWLRSRRRPAPGGWSPSRCWRSAWACWCRSGWSASSGPVGMSPDAGVMLVGAGAVRARNRTVAASAGEGTTYRSPRSRSLAALGMTAHPARVAPEGAPHYISRDYNSVRGGFMAGAKIMVLYPTPRDSAVFERVYRDEHTPMVTPSAFPGITRFVASRITGTADGGKAPFVRVAELHFPSLQALQAAAGSDGAKGRWRTRSRSRPVGRRSS